MLCLNDQHKLNGSTYVLIFNVLVAIISNILLARFDGRTIETIKYGMYYRGEIIIKKSIQCDYKLN